MLSIEEIKSRLNENGFTVDEIKEKIDELYMPEISKRYIVNSDYELIVYEDDIEDIVKLNNYVSENIPGVIDKPLYADNHIYMKKIEKINRFKISLYNEMSEEEKNEFSKALSDTYEKIHSLEIPDYAKDINPSQNKKAICIGPFNLFNIKIKDNKFDGFISPFVSIDDPDYDYSFVVDSKYNDISKRMFKKSKLDFLRLKNEILILKDDTSHSDYFSLPESYVEAKKKELEAKEFQFSLLLEKNNKIKK